MDNSSTDEDSAAAMLCATCGLCCDGTLFTHAHFAVGEDPAAYPALDVFTVKGRPAYRHPCTEYRAGAGCRIYERRPAQCRDFRCGLLKRLERRELEPDLALAPMKGLVAEVRAALDDLRTALAQAGLDPVQRPVPLVLRQFTHMIRQECRGSEEADVRRRHGTAFLAYGRLRLMMTQRFEVWRD